MGDGIHAGLIYMQSSRGMARTNRHEWEALMLLMQGTDPIYGTHKQARQAETNYKNIKVA